MSLVNTSRVRARALLLIISGLFAGTCLGRTFELEFEADVTVASAHVWRGFIFNDEPVIHPSISVHSGELSLGAWSTWDVDYEEGSSARQRWDFTADYMRVSDRHIFMAGLAAYVYHDDPGGVAKDTYDVYVGYAVDVPSLPSVRLYYDVGKIESYYTTFSLAHSFPLHTERLALEVRAQVAAADGDYVRRSFGIAGAAEGFTVVDATASLSLPFAVNESFAIIPAVSGMMLLDGDLKEAVKGAGMDDDELWGSVSVRGYF